jgi:energy-coupling factor transporter ATP-binding protein EcfA2
MSLGITLKNYRCFPDDQPASFRLDKGFTALVGSNNSGKSTLLKFFWEFRHLLNHMASPTPNFSNALRGNGGSLTFQPTVRDHEEVFSNRNNRGLTIEFDFSELDLSEFPNLQAPLPTRLIIGCDRTTRNWSSTLYFGQSPLNTKDQQISFPGEGTSLLLSVGGQRKADFTPIFKLFEKLRQCIYIPAYRNAINAGSVPQYFDIQTGQAFIAQWRAWQAGDNKDQSRAARRLTDTIRDIFKFERLEVNAANNNETLQLYIDNETYLLPELGSGIAQFFMVLANVAVKKPPFVLIDEPELNLHPSLQRAFLRALATYATEGVVFSTHNIGLALAQADRTYSVQRIAHGRSSVTPYEETPRLPEFLGELSFAGYKQLGFEKVLLVEGVTDMRAIQHFLSLYGKQDKILLLPLGGSTLINGSRQEELQEVQRICPHVHALIDSEKDSVAALLERSRQAFIAACGGLPQPIPCHVLDRRALENYFTDAAVKAVLGPTLAALAHYDKPPKNWKVDNWRIAQEMTRVDIATTDLGTFLDSL